MHSLTRLLFACLFLSLAGCGSSGGGGSPGGGGGGGEGGGGGGGGTVDPCDMPGVVCECDEDADCGEFELCDLSGPGRLCECLAGYEGDPCVWGTIPDDPGFQNMPLAWTGERGAVVDAEADGAVDPGQTSFPDDALCNFGSVSQIVTMPPLQGSQPFVAEVSYRSVEDFFNFYRPPLSMGMGGAWRTDPIAPRAFETRSYCLGEAAYGGEVEIELSNGTVPSSCPSNADLNVDRFQIVPADPGQCPAPGEVNNGDFEADGGWEFTMGGIEDGVGADGSRGGRVGLETRCESGRMTGTLSVPSASTMPSPALVFWWNVTNGFDSALTFDGRTATFLEGKGIPQTARYCLPPWTQGGVHSLTVAAPSGGSGLCSELIPREVVLDDVRIVDEPSCGTNAGVLDPGFESAPIALLGAFVVPGTGSVAAVVDPALARSGEGVLEVSISVRCNTNAYNFSVVTPEPDAVGGPAIRFWHRIPNNPVSSARAVAGRNFITLPENGEWTEAVLCLDPALAGRPSEISLGLNGGSGLCDSFGGTEYGYFDDLELITDAACPTE